MTIAHAALAIGASLVVMILIMVTLIWRKLRFSCHRLRRTQTSAATRETMLVQHWAPRKIAIYAHLCESEL